MPLSDVLARLECLPADVVVDFEFLRICETFSELPRLACVVILRLERSGLDFATSWEREGVGAASRCLPAPRRWQARLGLRRCSCTLSCNRHAFLPMLRN